MATLSLLTPKIQYINNLLLNFFLKLVNVIHDNPGRIAYFLHKKNNYITPPPPQHIKG